MSEEIRIARQWVAKARHDLPSADNNLSAAEVPYDTVCFHCQQAAEKLLKAFLVGNGRPPPRSHDLFLLLETVGTLSGEPESLREALAILMPYAVEIRQPQDGIVPSEEDAREAREAAGQVLGWLNVALPEVFSIPS